MKWIDYPNLEKGTPQYNIYRAHSRYLDQLEESERDIQINGFCYSKSDITWNDGKYYLYGALHLCNGDWIKSKSTDPESFSLLYQLANTLNWNDYKKVTLHLEVKEEDGIRFYVFSNCHNKQIIGIVSPIFQDLDEWERVNQTFKIDAYKGIVDFSLEKDNSSYLFIFKDKTKKEIVYINPELNINGDNLEAKYTWQELNSDNKPSEDDEEFKEIAQKFNRTPEDVKKLKERYIETNREKLAGFDELKYYIRNIIPSTEKGTVIYGAFTRNSGQALIYDTNITEEPFLSADPEEKGLFELFKSGNREIPEGNFTLKININDNEKPTLGITQNGENTESNIIQIFKDDLEKEDGFLNKYIRMLDSEDKEFYLNISFEDITFGKTNFNSYVFAISANIHLCNISTSGFYKYLMYIKYLENERANEEKHKKAIASAIAAIMSRNMSHNLGSHFLYYSQQDFANLSGSLRDMFYEKDEPKEKVFVQKNGLNSLLGQTEKSYEYTKGASKVFEFLQDRMYYLAAITGIERSQSLPVLLKSQVLDFITKQNDFRNFYLNNLVRSEQYTLEAGTSIKLDDKGKDFDDLSISLPLGSISTHAIYNIFENFIRNSAKYQWDGIPKPPSLVFTIKVIENDSDIIIQIFDSKKSAKHVKKFDNGKSVNLIDYMNNKLCDIHFLDADDSLNNEDKGLKEMLLSAFWINNRQKDKSIGEIIYDFEKSGNKEAFLKNYGLVFVADSNEKEGNLGVEFHVNKHYYVLSQDKIKDHPYLTSDIVIVSDAESKEYEYGREVSEAEKLKSNIIDTLKKYVVAPLDIKQNEDYRNTINLLKSINGRLGVIDKNVLDINKITEDKMYEENCGYIVYSDHMSSSADELGNADDVKDRYDTYVYYDSISGGNYTKQLVKLSQQLDIFDESCLKKYETWKSRYYSLLIKESALTRIAIIDERFFNTIRYLSIDQYKDGQPIKGTSIELDFKNIQVLNLLSELQKSSARDVRFTKRTKGRYKFVGNDFRDANTTKIPHFLSIHFSIIQKLLERDGLNMSRESVNTVIRNIIQEIYGNIYCYNCNSIRDCDNKNVRDIIKECDNIRVTIHSGRGTLSKQEREALSEYNVIPLGALRSAFLDSKYILCQLFYNLRYKKIER